MSFMGVNDRVRRVLHVTQLTKIFVLHRSLEDAVAAHEAGCRVRPGHPRPGAAGLSLTGFPPRTTRYGETEIKPAAGLPS